MIAVNDVRFYMASRLAADVVDLIIIIKRLWSSECVSMIDDKVIHGTRRRYSFGERSMVVDVRTQDPGRGMDLLRC